MTIPGIAQTPSRLQALHQATATPTRVRPIGSTAQNHGIPCRTSGETSSSRSTAPIAIMLGVSSCRVVAAHASRLRVDRVHS